MKPCAHAGKEITTRVQFWVGDYNDLMAFVEGKNDLRYFADSDQIAKEQYIELKLCHLEEIILNRVSGERVRVTENGQEREKKKTSEESEKPYEK